jgi:1,4-dihydroxy-2-naphthoyl-CoA hydrolase
VADPDVVAPPTPRPVPSQDSELIAKMGIVVSDWNPRRMVATMPVKGNRQPYGLLHGGASCVLAETLGSLAAVLNAGPDRTAVGIEINATHHRAARSGVVTGVCTPLHTGRTIATFDVAISDGAGRRVCTARVTCALRAATRPVGS